MKISLVLCIAASFLSTVTVAGTFPKLDPDAFLPRDGTFILPAVMTVAPGARADIPFTRVHHLPKSADVEARKARLRAIGAAVPAVVEIILVVPYKITRMQVGPGMFIQTMENDGKKHILSRGSGVIIRKDGRVVTNGHVIDGAKENGAEIFIKLDNDPSPWDIGPGDIPVEILANRPTKKDLAFLKIKSDRTDWPVIPFAEEPLQIGDEVIAVGYPGGGAVNVTGGMVGNLHVKFQDEAGEFIQHSAIVSPGSSGGALLDMDGHLTGINTAILRGAPGVGYAIPFQDVVDSEKALDAAP